jgi:hypothetical protein
VIWGFRGSIAGLQNIGGKLKYTATLTAYLHRNRYNITELESYSTNIYAKGTPKVRREGCSPAAPPPPKHHNRYLKNTDFVDNAL